MDDIKARIHAELASGKVRHDKLYGILLSLTDVLAAPVAAPVEPVVQAPEPSVEVAVAVPPEPEPVVQAPPVVKTFGRA